MSWKVFIIEILNSNLIAALIGVLGVILGWYLGIIFSKKELNVRSDKIKKALCLELKQIKEELIEKEQVIRGNEVVPIYKYEYPYIFANFKILPLVYEGLGGDIYLLDEEYIEGIKRFFSIREKLFYFDLRELSYDENKKNIVITYIDELLKLSNKLCS